MSLPIDALSAALAPAWGGEDSQRYVVVETFVYSFALFVCIFLVWAWFLAPMIPRHQQCTADEQVQVGHSIVSIWPAASAPVFALLSMRHMPWHDATTLMVSPCDTHALRAIGLSCGYMFYDTLYCLRHKVMRSPLLIGHHVLPIIFWPYCALNERALPIVLFFVITEVTNIGQHMRMLMVKFKLEGYFIYKIVGVTWCVGFFLVRILPSPYVLYQLLSADYSKFSGYQFWCVVLLTPLPFLLNGFWFFLIASGVVKFLKKSSKAKQG